MEDKVKILETKLKLSTDILSIEYYLLHDLREIAKESENILLRAKDGESTDENIICKFNGKQFKVLLDLIYTTKSENLTSQNTSEYLKSKAREKEIKQEILNGL